MPSPTPPSGGDRPLVAIAILLLGMTAISVQDVLIKLLSGGYPLHQIVFARSSIAICVTLLLVQWEGGFRILRTATPGLHLVRGLLVVGANMTYFAALAVLPLAEATALFFVSPLLITVFAAFFLGESLGPRRLAAIAIGFVGVAMIALADDPQALGTSPTVVYLLPILAAVFYALMQVLTRRLGHSTKVSALAAYIQLTFIAISLAIGFSIGHGRLAEGVDNPSLVFLLRAWRLPEGDDWWLFIGIGALSAVIGYALSYAYKMASAGAVAPFEYVALPLAVIWGWLVWGELPTVVAAIGIAMIMAAGVYVFLRESARGRPLKNRRAFRRW